MNYDEILKLTKKYNDEDLVQDVVVYILENNISEEKYEDAVKECYRKIRNKRINDEHTLAHHIIGDDDEELDENYYFVDPKSIEVNEVKIISDELEEKGRKLAGCIMNLNKILDRTIRDFKSKTFKYQHFNRNNQPRIEQNFKKYSLIRKDSTIRGTLRRWMIH